ncbi:GNAT family N-acetyltransferase [Methylobacterium nodulans]|uniref:GCN5-related N-acetyltransferase n=1 Tax=Methylobacterium nodulans (strain LMG 21967 / CNCM I-2342 / ORS 2060) TaxID=460265 RepID=B8IDJ8_METNO|nr:GNAT family N-acetyltransferase [Methylobacterium nodulans]ACL61364.1 GCN5-related N-acetyltransferase [Methylobacterium nodulans ORS 2060]
MITHIRAAMPSDAKACGHILYHAFEHIAGSHGFPPDFPSIEPALGLAEALISNPSVFGVVAEVDGQVVGSNFLSEGDTIRGVGPITVDPKAQGSGIGRRLMQAVVDRANGAAGIRLLQDAFNMRSYALYASLGFEVREPVLVMAGRPAGSPPADLVVRPMTERDLDACDALCTRVHDISRYHELTEAVRLLAPLVAERDGRITAYMTAPSFWIANHGVAESENDMQALILGAATTAASVSFLLPTRQKALLSWCLDQGLKAVKPMTLMTMGKYREPDRPYMPSVFY